MRMCVRPTLHVWGSYAVDAQGHGSAGRDGGGKGDNKWGRSVAAEEWEMEGWCGWWWREIRSRGGGFGVIRWKRLWSVTFKRWATLQGTSAWKHTHIEKHTNNCQLLSPDEKTGGQEERGGEWESREGVKWIPPAATAASSLSEESCVHKGLWKHLDTFEWHKQTHSDNNYSSVLPSLLFIPQTALPPLFLSILHLLIKTKIFCR